MRFMILVKATRNSEAGVMPEDALIAEMAEYHEALARAGVLRDASGLRPSRKGWRIHYAGGARRVTDGPFAETKELLAGYTLLEVKSREEAVEWSRRFPNPAPRGQDGAIEVRQLFELDDFEPTESVERFRDLGLDRPAPGGGAARKARISPFLWFDHQAEEAARFYTAVFPNSRVGRVTRYGEAGPGPAGTAMSVTFELDGQEFLALNGGPMFTFSPAISFFVRCETHAEVDHFWARLSEGGTIQRCGWLQDRYGVSWQIVPTVLGDMLGDPDPARARRVMEAMLQMTKLDIAGLERAYR